MTEDGRTNGLVIGIVLLVIALIAVPFLWQRERESTDPEVEVGSGPAQVLFHS